MARRCLTCGAELNTPEHYADYCGVQCVPIKGQEKPKKKRTWKCTECGQLVIAHERPEGFGWTDGHNCTFVEVNE